MKNREYLGDVFSSGTVVGGASSFQLTQYSINPGLSASFPWLSGVAINYQQFRFHGLLFEFKSTSGNAVSSSNAALGTVVMATNYNADAPPFFSKKEILNTEFSSVSSPAADVLHPIECKPRLTTIENLYVRSGALPPNQDYRLSDLGLFQIATEGVQAATINLGELWVTYDCELLKPITSPTALQEGAYARYKFACCADDDAFGLIAGGLPPTLAPVNGQAQSIDQIGLQFSSLARANAQSVILPSTMPTGNYLWIWTLKVDQGNVSPVQNLVLPPFGYTPVVAGTLSTLPGYFCSVLSPATSDSFFAPQSTTPVTADNVHSVSVMGAFFVGDSFVGGRIDFTSQSTWNFPFSAPAAGIYNGTFIMFPLPLVGF